VAQLISGKYALVNKKIECQILFKSRRIDFSSRYKGVRIKNSDEANEDVENVNLNLGKRIVYKISSKEAKRRFKVCHDTSRLGDHK
jgi:hypothetical protein